MDGDLQQDNLAAEPPAVDVPPPYQLPLGQGIRAAPVQYVRHLPSFKHGADLLIFLRRFHSYCQALRVPDEMLSSLLVAHLDDSALRGISRYLDQNLTFLELVDVLKKAEGYHANNTDKFITDMAARKRLKTEKVHDFFVDLSRMSELAYPRPDQEQVKTANLRQEFMKNINHPLISARLREHPEMDIDQLLDLAILLENCFEASKVPSYQVNSITEEEQDTMGTKISNLTNMVEKLVINQLDQSHPNANSTEGYQYQGNMAPRGLRQTNVVRPTRRYDRMNSSYQPRFNSTPNYRGRFSDDRYSNFRRGNSNRRWNSAPRFNNYQRLQEQDRFRSRQGPTYSPQRNYQPSYQRNNNNNNNFSNSSNYDNNNRGNIQMDDRTTNTSQNRMRANQVNSIQDFHQTQELDPKT